MEDLAQSESSLDQQIVEWQSTRDAVWADHLITIYRPFILKTLSDLSGRFIDVVNDDEYSIGLQAFYEAMQRFDNRGSHFLTFARLVIASRLKTFWQKEKRSATLSLDDYDIASDDVDRLVSELSMADEITRFTRKLHEYGLDFAMLVAASPKHRDTREDILSIARRVSQTPELMDFLRRKKRLPIQLIARRLGVSAKVVKRNKIYLLASTLIFANPESEIANWLNAVDGRK